jgi:hypothetical protein
MRAIFRYVGEPRAALVAWNSYPFRHPLSISETALKGHRLSDELYAISRYESIGIQKIMQSGEFPHVSDMGLPKRRFLSGMILFINLRKSA